MNPADLDPLTVYTSHFDKRWDVPTGGRAIIQGRVYPIYKSALGYAPTGAKLRPWRDTEYKCSKGFVTGEHDIVYLDPEFRTYIRVPK